MTYVIVIIVRRVIFCSFQVEAKIFELQEAMVERGFSDVEIEEKVGDTVLVLLILRYP